MADESPSSVGISADLERLRKQVEQRERADPLMPSECQIEPGLGESKAQPCHTTFFRLMMAPEKFHGRWIAVSGMYANRSEESALHSPDYDSALPPIFQHHLAVWVDPLIDNGRPLSKATVLGKFHHGPSGHLSAYFGQLSNASVTTGRLAE